MAAGARQQRVDEHVGYVRAIATRVRKELSTRLELDDLVGYGTAGLLEAADRFDERYGVAFSTFAYHRIRGAIYDGLRRMGTLPRAEYAKLRASERAHAYLANLAEREQGAVADGAPPKPSAEDDLRAMYEALSGVATSFVVSLEVEGEVLDETPGADEVLEKRQLGARMQRALAALPEKERHFIEKHYFEGKTLTDAGVELGLSKSWASRLHARAVDKLRELLDAG